MKLFMILYLTNSALAAGLYHVVPRGVSSERGLLPGRGVPLRAGINAKVNPLRRVPAKAAPNTGGDAPKPSGGSPKRTASVSGKGPAEIFYVDEHGNNISHHIPKGAEASRKSTHPTRPQVGGLLKGAPSGDEPLKVSAEGKYAGIIASSPLEGSGHVKVTGGGASKEANFGPGEDVKAIAHMSKGGAKAEARVSRPGEAFAISYDSPADVKLPGEVFEKPKEEKP